MTTQEQIQKIKSKMQEMQEEVEKLEKIDETNQWKPRFSSAYWFVSITGLIQSSIWFNTEYDKSCWAMGNCYPTKEFATKACDKQLLITEINRFIEEKNEGWQPDWNDEDEEKYNLGYSYLDKNWKVNYEGRTQYDFIFKPAKSYEIISQVITHFQDRLHLLLEK